MAVLCHLHPLGDKRNVVHNITSKLLESSSIQQFRFTVIVSTVSLVYLIYLRSILKLHEDHIRTLLDCGQMTRTIPGPIPSSQNFSATSMIGRLNIASLVDQITLGPHIWRFLDGIRFRIWYHPAQKPSLYHQPTSGSVF
ncbi:hypothetical protein AVEN_257474-1 [Araneus ventricosus]|uniref:Uncharacterized protein n=1 Tax=Araneus ventricosus TaxID=182803 RepID=A0A4Y1ZM73_ARAVE|nr:hypothetical protein AVEN_257474-1 [Araneus ventricosus]